MKHQNLSTTPEVSKRMSNVHLKESETEIRLAKELWKKGYRYRKNYRALPGSPDIAILKYHIAVFIDGEFWHGKDWVAKKDKLKSNRDYWIEKIEENMARDARVDSELRSKGWIPIRLWEKEVKANIKDSVNRIENLIISRKLVICSKEK